MAVAAFGQGWPVPGKSPSTEVPCSKCTGVSPPADGKTVGYVAPISTLTGRVLDSQATNDIQQPLRTLRAGKMVLSPDGRRLYMLAGGLVAAWDTATFFTRLASGESLMTSPSFPLSVPIQRSGAPEVILRPDRFFYAEWGSPWTCPYVDGQARLNDFDVDDQGYLYLSHFVFGWGIVKDDLRTDGSLQLMASQYQHFPYGDAGDMDPIHILSFKSGSDYYALINVSSQTEVWKVTDRTHPVRVFVNQRMNFSQAAKNTSGDRIAIMDGSTGAISVYTGDALAAGGSALASFSPSYPFQFASVTSDGTNFFGAFTQPTVLKIAVITPSGNTFVQSSVYDTGVSDNGAAIRASGGYLTVILPSGLLLYKVSASLGFTPVALKSSQGGSYFAQYYFNFAPAGYGFPHFYVHAADAGVIKSGSKSYLVFDGGGLADVYELQTADGINIAPLGSTGTQNSNTPPTERVKTFYGDPISFSASTTAPAPMTINWNFGNPEAVAGADGNIAPPPSGAGQTGSFIVTHRYSGIGSAANLTPRTVTVANTLDSSIFSTASVTMQPPLGRIGIVGFSDCTIVPVRNCFDQNFIQVGPTQPLPIVAADKWFDASDGSLEGHTDSWTITPGTPPPPTGPAQVQDVGPCGTSSLTYAAHYGQNGTLLTQTDYKAPAGGLTVQYGVKPFAAYATLSSVPGSPSVTFTNATRFGDPTILTPAIKSALVYKWELLNGAGGTIAGPTGDFATTATWVVQKTTVTHGMVARLTVTSATDFAAPCAGFTSSQYSTAPLNAPDPVVNITGGSCTTSPCTFTAASLSGIDTVAAGWTYQWSITGGGASGTGQTFVATFPISGSYTVSVAATNNVGAASASTQALQVTVSLCADYRPNIDVFIDYNGPNSGCTESPQSAACQANEGVQFRVATISYLLSCAPHTYFWDFGDGTTGTGQSITHSFTSGTTHTVTCAVTDTSNASNNHTLSQNVKLGTIIINDPCFPGMTSSSVSMAYGTNSGSCSNSNASGACGVGETISFSAAGFPYNFGCGAHSFSWTFGDGTTGSGQTTTHAYATKGPYTVALYIVGPDNSINLTSNLTVGTGNNNLGCNPAMKANQTVFINYTDGDATCTDTNGGTCKANEQIQFSAGSFQYNYTCALHNFSWDFGDGHTGTGQQIAHSYATGTYTVTLTISNPDPSQTVQMTKTVKVGTILTTQPPTSVDFSVSPWTANGVIIPNGYAFTPESAPATAVTSWIWDFGDGICPGAGAAACNSTSYGPMYHLFPTGANYSITLIGKNSAGQATTVHLLLQAPPHRRSASH